MYYFFQIYWIGPNIGAIIGCGLYSLLFTYEEEKQEDAEIEMDEVNHMITDKAWIGFKNLLIYYKINLIVWLRLSIFTFALNNDILLSFDWELINIIIVISEKMNS